MPFLDRTDDFRGAVEAKRTTIPEAKRHKFSRPRQDGERGVQAGMGKEYLSEAYKILHHINTLSQMLANIRKPYLNVDARTTPLSRQASKNLDFTGEGGEANWASIRYLKNEERDQIDLQARVILSKCADRVKEMEILEKKRSDLVASRANPLARLLPARLRPDDDSTVASEFVAAHHASMTWYLSRRLAELSQTQKVLQEERVKRQLERTRTLGSNATREAQYLESSSDGSGGWVGVAASNLFAATLGVAAGTSGTPLSQRDSLPSYEPSVISDEEDDEIELTQSQILQFENENANMLREVQDNLESVMELVNHLTRQTELTEKLYDDAIATTSMVEKGNRQLKEAKQRVKDSRLFLLVFLLGASFSLLFLHYY
ncbi:Syntaxin-18 [Leucoagaricus sp. SymC.cos]|nr:Syntaxin-18 [Leucoagaricus sp. SymC.cos]